MPERVHLTFFGTAAGYPTERRPHTTSIGVWRGEALYLFDTGASVASQFARRGIAPDALRAIFLTHLHADHVGGLAPLLQSIQLNGRTALLPLHVPDCSLDGLRDYLRLVYLFPVADFELQLGPVAGGVCYEEEGMSVEAIVSRHLVAGEERRREIGARVETQAFSYRVQADEKTIYLSGDIAEPEEAAEHAMGADVAVVELAHFEPEGLGAALVGSDVKRLFVTHLLASFEPLEGEIPDRIMAAGYEGEVIVAQDGTEIEL